MQTTNALLTTHIDTSTNGVEGRLRYSLNSRTACANLRSFVSGRTSNRPNRFLSARVVPGEDEGIGDEDL